MAMACILTPAEPGDAAAIAALRTAVAAHLTAAHGRGHWSSAVSERGVRLAMRQGRVFVVRQQGRVVATLCLTTRKPWTIDRTRFTPVARPLYLVDMAVLPERQGRGLGRRCLAEVDRLVAAWPADGVRLDAYDGPAGAGGFYEACGYASRGRATYRGTPLLYFERVCRPGPAAPA
jgi:GNAT superfamily N-acetyltransferase